MNNCAVSSCSSPEKAIRQVDLMPWRINFVVIVGASQTQGDEMRKEKSFVPASVNKFRFVELFFFGQSKSSKHKEESEKMSRK